MRRAFWIALLVGLMCCVPVNAAEVQHYRDLGIGAFFSSIDEQNIETGVFVSAGVSFEQSPGGIRLPRLSFYAYRYDISTGEYIWEDIEFKDLVPGEFEMDPSLSRATLNTSLALLNLPGPVTVNIQLQFEGINRAVRTRSAEHYHAGNLIVFTQEGGASRDARVTGSVIGPGNLTPDPPVYAYLFKTKSFAVRVE